MKSAVRLTRTMLSAISFGVSWRRAPSIIADHAVEEGVALLRGDADDDPVARDARAAGDGAAVAAAFADDRRGLAGDRGLVDGRDALDDLAVGRDQLAGGADDRSPIFSSLLATVTSGR